MNVVEEKWLLANSSGKLGDAMECLKQISIGLQMWSKQKFGNIPNHIKVCKEIPEALCKISNRNTILEKSNV